VKALTMTEALLEYVLANSDPLDEVQRTLIDQTSQLGDVSRMQIAPEQGPLLTFLVRLIGATRAVEVGTFTGLSSLAIAKGLPSGGSLTCFDISGEWTETAQRAWRAAGLDSRIELRLGDARQELRSLAGEDAVDLAFVDADKDGYVEYLELLLPHLRTGGLMLFDNTLSSGEVLSSDATGSAAHIQAFNQRLTADPRVDKVLLPVADGLTLVRKR
jgi:caffeoyl-CoA O-methyltransferase